MKEWIKYWDRDYSYHYIETCLHSFTENMGIAGFKNPKKLLFIRRYGNYGAYDPIDEKELFQAEVFEKIAKNSKTFKKFLDKFNKAADEYLRSAENISKQDIPNLSDDDLKKYLKEYYDAWIRYTVFLWVAFNVSIIYPEYISDYISKKAKELDLEKNIPKYFDYIFLPSKKSTILLLDDEIRKARDNDTKLDTDRLFKEYAWLPWGDLHAVAWTKKDIEKYIKNHKITDEKTIPFSEMKKELQLTDKEIEMIELSRDITYLRDYRDEVRRKAVYLAHTLYKEIADRFDILYDDFMHYYSTPETFDLFENKKLSDDEIKKRKQDTVSILVGGKLVVYSGKEMEQYLEEKGFHEKTPDSDEIKGIIASKGKVTGKVKIIKLDKELPKIEKGDIMVAVTTHPEYTIKMQVSSAIVTDEGGITCHAAIVSRELGIPCIVGTKNATNLLKDGDAVEVDADKGIVRKI